MIGYNLIRSNRKTIAIHITKDGVLEVRAPNKVPKSDIDRLVALKKDWIDRHLAMQMQNIQSKASFEIDYGDMVTLQGKPCQLLAKEGKRAGFDGEVFYIPPGLSAEEIKSAVIQIYKLVAKNILTNKVVYYAKHMNVEPTAVKVNSAKTRWGSCSSKNSLNFSWRLVMAEDNVINYVVVHELAHIIEHNHSDRFWAVVAGVLPDYRERQCRLKELQKRLARENWDL